MTARPLGADSSGWLDLYKQLTRGCLSAAGRGRLGWCDGLSAVSGETSMMRRPRLTLACELDPARLSALFADVSVLRELKALDTRIALMLSGLSDERAAVVQMLNRAVPLLFVEEGHYFTPDNV